MAKKKTIEDYQNAIKLLKKRMVLNEKYSQNEIQKQYAQAYNDARRDITNGLRTILGIDQL